MRDENERARYIADAPKIGHEIAFQEARTLAGLFDAVHLWKSDAPGVRPSPRNGVPLTPGKRGGSIIGTYCAVRGMDGHRDSLDVTPSAALVAWLRREMLDVDYDTLHFGVVDHGEGWALVYVSYGQIIGSRWLAYVESDSVPSSVRS